MNTKTEKENATLPEQRQLRTLHLFAGAGGGILADLLLGHRPVGAVEIEEYPRRVLLARQRDGLLPKFPIWDDVSTFDGKPWRGRVDVVCGGFPCQDISSAGKGAGIEGERSGMWKHMARIIGEIRPKYAFVENSPMLVGRGLAVVLGDLAEMGYDARWCVLGAGHIGMSHMRERIWLLASNSSSVRLQRGEPETGETKRESIERMVTRSIRRTNENDISKPFILGAGNGLANRVERTKAIGNGQVPAVAALAWRILAQGL